MTPQFQKPRAAKLSPRESPKRKTRFIASLLAAVLLWWGISPEIALARENPANGSQAVSVQPSLDRVIKQVTQFKLDNGMTFVVLERPRSPVASFLIQADVGGANEPDGKTGVAHYLEHLAFKGTQKIGTTDYKAEKPLLEKQDELFEQMQAAKASGKTQEVAKFKAEFDKIEAEAGQFVKRNEFGKIVEQAGGVGLNAATSTDSTMYFYSLPANKLELWMSLESERFLEPVFREFYKEKQVILEERRLRTENSAIGQMVEAFASTAFSLPPPRNWLH
jgi:predicted Zn-dependent peptidase